MSTKQKIITVTAVVCIAAVATLVTFMDSRKSPPDINEYKDPLSGQTVSDPEGKSPESFGISDNQPIFLGFDALLKRGLTFEQLNNLKQAFYNYSESKPQPLDEISADISSIASHRGRSGDNIIFYLQFDVRFDRKETQKARVDYNGLNSIRLYISDASSGKVIYDSQTIGSGD